jgi:hypothetical protein
MGGEEQDAAEDEALADQNERILQLLPDIHWSVPFNILRFKRRFRMKAGALAPALAGLHAECAVQRQS